MQKRVIWIIFSALLVNSVFAITGDFNGKDDDNNGFVDDLRGYDIFKL